MGSPYAIIPSAATGGTFVPANYTIGYVNGVLTVTPVIVVEVPPVQALAVAVPTVVTLTDTSPQLLTLPLPVAPPVILVAAPVEAPLVVPAAAPVFVLVQSHTEIYVAPHRPRKQDRN